MTLAYFSKPKAFAGVFAIVAMIVAFYALIFVLPGGFFHYLSKKPQFVVFFFVGLPGSFWLGYLVVLVLVQIFRHGAKAIWIDQGYLVVINKRYLHRRLSEIASCEPFDSPHGPLVLRQIVIRYKDGSSRRIAASLLRPARDDIVASLNDLSRSQTAAAPGR